MKRVNIIGGLGLLIALSMAACYPGGYETYEETDIVVTDYNTNYNFSGIGTYFIPDTIHYIGEDDPDRSWDNFIIGELEQGFESMGYTRSPIYTQGNPTDVVITVSILTNENTDIYSYPWYPGWGYGGWGYPGYGWGYWGNPGYGYGYPWGGYTYISSYSIGSLIWNIWDPDNVIDETTTIPIEYTAVLNGLMGSSTSTTQNRLADGIDKAFQQSPYLRANK